MTDAAGAVVERYGYGDYGEPAYFDGGGNSIGASAIGNPYLFHGRRYDPETGLYYYRTRYLDPKVGRFLSRDTIGQYGDPANLGNGLAFVGNNPWSRPDPYGEDGTFPAYIYEKDEETGNVRQEFGDYTNVAPAVGRVATTGTVVFLNAFVWGMSGPILGVPVTGLTIGIAGDTAYNARQAQYINLTAERLPRIEGIVAATADVTGASAVYAVGWGEDSVTGEKLSTGERVESGAHLAVGLFAAYGGAKTGRLVTSQPTRMVNFSIESGKFDYIFGRVKSNPHNAARSNQLALTMKNLGLYDTPTGRAILTEHFKSIVNREGNVVRRYSNPNGSFEVRSSLFFGPKGRPVILDTTFKVIDDGTRVFVTTIPKGQGAKTTGGQ